MNEGIYWPGTEIVKSSQNGFTQGLSDRENEWRKLSISTAQRQVSAGHVERRRREGTDTSTFRGLSKKSDLMRQPVGAMKQSGRPIEDSSKAGRMRKLLEKGPMTRRELAERIGVPGKNVAGLLQNDMDRGRIGRVYTPGEFMRYALIGGTDE